MRDNESTVCESPGIASSRPAGSRKLLWVDDSQSLLVLYEAVFGSLGFEVHVGCSALEALDHLSSHGADVVILDYEMPEMDGCALATLIKNRYPELPVILYSGSLRVPQNADRWVDAICPKTAPREHLLALIEALAQRNGSEGGKHVLGGKYGEEVAELPLPPRGSCAPYSRKQQPA